MSKHRTRTVQAKALQFRTGQENVLLMAITLDDGTRIDRPTAEEHKRVEQGCARGQSLKGEALQHALI